MNVIFNIIVLLFEVLYYALFMKFTRKEGKLWRYLLSFSLITIVGLFIGTTNLFSCLILIFMMTYGLKYVVKLKVSLYDVMIVLIMMLLNVLIEFPVYTILNGILMLSITTSTIIFEIVKLLTVLFLRKILNRMYFKLKAKWQNNNFYIRYLFTTFLYIYTIISLFLLIGMR